jgi:hypothetical protein
MDRALDRIAVAICGLWIAILLFSGFAEPIVRTLHLFQSAIYVAVILLIFRKSKWAFGVGISIALVWNDYNLHTGFVFRAGFQRWRELLTGQGVKNAVQLLAPVAFFAHVLLIIVLAARYFRRRDKQLLDAPGFGVSFVVTVAYFAVILSLYGPQYLPKFLDLFALR